jgi:hypothetical protein
MVEDTLYGQRPTLWLSAGVAWGGLRERVRGWARTLGRRRRKDLRAGDGFLVDRGWAFFMAGFLVASLPDEFGVAVPAAKAAQATAILDAEIAIAAFSVAVIVARGLIVLPAFGRFLRAGGWPKIRRRVGPLPGALTWHRKCGPGRHFSPRWSTARFFACCSSTSPGSR